MVKIKNAPNPVAKKYAKMGIVAAAVVAVVAVTAWGISNLRRSGGYTYSTIERALSHVSTDAVSGADLRIAVIRMDAIQEEARVLQALRSQREEFEGRLRDELTREQRALERERTEIERSQDVLSREALQRRVMDYQQRVNNLQRDLTERAQSIEASFQRALMEIQNRHLDPLIEGIIARKDLSLVIDGRFARMGNVQGLDITPAVIEALNKRISNIRMDRPQGF